VRAACPDCGGRVRRRRVVSQYQEDLPVQRPVVHEFRVAIGQCQQCHRRVQGRHPQQTSDALGAAAVQLGPQAVALAVILNKQLGLSFGKIEQLLRARFGLTVTRGGLVHAVHCVARQAQPTYDALCTIVRGSPAVTPDETGRKVWRHDQWLWAFATPDTTVYAIQQGRGFTQATAVLGDDYAGVLQRDGWAPYRQFVHALHQTCLAHLLRRCRTMMLDHPAHPFAPQVNALLRAALTTRDRHRAGDVSVHGLAVARGQYLARLAQLIDRRPSRLAEARRFAGICRPNTTPSSASLRSDARRHQLARRTRPAAGRHHAQDVRRWQSHDEGRADPTDPRLGPAHLAAARARRHRRVRTPPAGTHTHRLRRDSVTLTR
jgi:transposase